MSTYIESPKAFESPAEKLAYPIILHVAEALEFSLEYQKEYNAWDYREWVYRRYPGSLPCWITSHQCSDYPGDSVDCIICYTYTKYRVDFLLTGNGLTVAIEVDGREFHKDKDHDAERDAYLEALGVKVVRIPASDVIWRPEDVKARLVEQLGGTSC